MSDAVIRTIHFDDLKTHYAPHQRYAFYATPPVDVTSYDEQSVLYQDCKMLGIFEGEKSVATTITLPMTQNVRGKIFKMGGVAGVTSDPMARRKGYVKRLMQQAFRDMYNDGTAVSTLYPFRESFYERLGYTAFTHIKSVKFKTADMKPLLNLNLSGTTEYHLQKEAWSEVHKVMQKEQQNSHGLGLFAEDALKYLFGDVDWWFVLARDDSGKVIGAMSYKITGYKGTFEVQNFFVQNSLARYLLLQFIAKHIDQTPDVLIKRLNPDYRPETWFSDLDMKSNPDIWITAMGRVINIRELNGLQVGSGKVTIQVQDADCKWNNGIFTFEAHDGTLSISDANDEQADCTLTIQGLSALIYGTHDLQDFQWRGWGNLSDELIHKLNRLFPPRNPFLFVVF